MLDVEDWKVGDGAGSYVIYDCVITIKEVRGRLCTYVCAVGAACV